MPVPVVTCGPDQVFDYSAGSQQVDLTAVITNSPSSITWTMLSVPEGSTVDVGVNGDFTDGVATVQNPTFYTEGGMSGSVVCQCVASNIDGASDPTDETTGQEKAQTVVSVKTQDLEYVIPNDKQYNWGKAFINPLIRAIEADIVENRAAGVKRSVADKQLWVNFTSGDDANDGLTEGNAKATLDGIMEVMDDLIDNSVTLNLRGTLTSSWYASKVIEVGPGGQLCVDGGDGLTELLASTAADIGTVDTIGNTGSSWTVDEYRGLWVEVIGGTYDGYKRLIKSNTATTITFTESLPGVPGAANFRVVRPATAFNGVLSFQFKGQEDSIIFVQRLFGNTGATGLYVSGGGSIYVSSIVVADGDIQISDAKKPTLYNRILHPTTYSWDGTHGTPPSTLGTANTISVSKSQSVDVKGVVTSFLQAQYCSVAAFDKAVVDKQMNILQVLQAGLTSVDITDREASAQGLYLAACQYAQIAGGLAINGKAHGIRVDRGPVFIDVLSGIVSGSNTVYGVRLFDKTTFRFASGATPTISGTSGDITINNSAEDATWAAIAGGTPYVHTGARVAVLRDGDSLPSSSGSGTDPDAVHVNVSSEIDGVTLKASPATADIVLIEDSAAGLAKKKVTLGTIPGDDPKAFHYDEAAQINGLLVEKASPVAADVLMIEDSQDSYNKKKVQVTNFPASDADAIHDNVAGEIAAVTEKASPVSADVLLIEDSADSNNKKRVQVGNLPGGTDADAIHDNVAGEIAAVTEKASPVSADLILIEDSADSNNKKRVQVGNLPGGGGAGSDTTAIHDDTASEISAITLKALPTASDLILIEDVADSNNKKRVTAGTVADIAVPQPAPSGLVEAVSAQGASDIDSGASYVQFWPTSGTETLDIPYTGDYKITFSQLMWGKNGDGTGILKIVFDEGESFEQSVGDSDDWQFRVHNTQLSDVTRVGQVTLTQGTHTAKVYFKTTAGNNPAYIGSGTAEGVDGKLTLELLSGSGAGGLVRQGGDLAANYATPSLPAATPTFHSPSEWSFTVRLLAGEVLHVIADYEFYVGSYCTNGPCIRIDGSRMIALDDFSAFGPGTKIVQREFAVSGLSAGLHTVEVGTLHDFGVITFQSVRHTGSGSVENKLARVELLQFRGGLVPIQHGGTEVLTKPAALNFIGAIASVTNNNNVADIELLTPVTAAGSIVEVDVDPPTSGYIDSGVSYVQFIPSSGSTSFTVPYTGTYHVALHQQFWARLGHGTGGIKLVIDEGEANEQTIADGDTDKGWRIRMTSGAANKMTITTPCNLTAGTHTLKAYFKTLDDSGVSIIGTATTTNIGGSKITFQYLAGSGAGGTIKTEKSLTANKTISNSAAWGTNMYPATENWQDIDNGSGDDLQVTVTVVANEEVEIRVKGYAVYGSSSGDHPFWVGIDIDGTVEVLGQVHGAHEVDMPSEFHVDYVKTFATAGTKTIKAVAMRPTANQNVIIVGSTVAAKHPATITVLQRRGGLVPHRSQGVEVLSKPQAIDYVGGLSASDNSGILIVTDGGLTFNDPLNDSSIDTRWTQVPQANATISEDSSKLTMTMTGATDWFSGTKTAPYMYFDLPAGCDFDCSVFVSGVATGDFKGGGIMLMGANSTDRVNQIRVGTNSGVGLVYFAAPSTGPKEGSLTSTYGWLRMIKKGSDLSLSYKDAVLGSRPTADKDWDVWPGSTPRKIDAVQALEHELRLALFAYDTVGAAAISFQDFRFRTL